MWVTQPAHLRYRDVGKVVIIILCVKVTYLCDNEHGVNRYVEPELMDLKRWFQGKLEYLQFVPLILCFFLENKISRHYYFGLLQNLMAHSLTAALVVYTGLLVHNRTNKWEHPDLK